MSERVAEGIAKKARWLVLALVGFVLARALSMRRRPRDPLHDRLNEVPIDDEPLTPEDEQELRRARAETPVPWDQARQRLSEPD